MSDTFLIFVLLSCLASHNYSPIKQPSKFWAALYAGLALVYFVMFIQKFLA